MFKLHKKPPIFTAIEKKDLVEVKRLAQEDKAACEAVHDGFTPSYMLVQKV
jgi:hypothetical protein